MARALLRRAGLVVVAAVGALVAAAIVWAPWAERGADTVYDTSVAEPQLSERRPRVLFDEGHENAHSISGRFSPFARLLRADGCRVAARSGAITPEGLEGCDVLVVVNARGPDGGGSAFRVDEIAAVTEWVRAGGALLLVADHHPFGPAAADLAKEFGVTMVGGWCDDEANLLPGTADSGAIALRRDKGMLGEHPILSGVDVVGTFTGQSLVAPEGAAVLLRLGDSAVDRVPVGSKTETQGGRVTTTFETRDTSAAGHCQGLAMEFGKGRVVVLGEAAMLSAQVDARSGLKFGMNVPGVDNREFVLNCVRWLARAPE